MLKFLLTLLIVLALGGAVAYFFGGDNSYVFIDVGGWQLENNISVLLLLILISYVLLWLVIKLVLLLWHAPEHLDKFNNRRRQTQCANELSKGLVDFIECRFDSAEKTLLHNAKHSQTPLLNYLGAARAAAQLGNSINTEKHLAAALKAAPDCEVAVLLTRAEIELNHNELQKALATLTLLRQKAPNHSSVLKLLSRLYWQLRDWSKLSQLLPILKKSRVLSAAQIEALSLDTYEGVLQSAGNNELEQTVHEAWNALPRMMRKDKRLISVYIIALIQSGEHQQAEQILRDALNKNWDEGLVKLYGQLHLLSADILEQHLARWENAMPKSPNLLLSMARIKARQNQVAAAKNYYQAAIKAAPSVEAYAELQELQQSSEAKA